MKRIPVLVLALPLACVFDKQLDPQADDTDGGSESSESSEASTVDDVGDPSVTTENSSTTVVPPDDDSGTDSTSGGTDAACGFEEAVLVTEFDAVQDGTQWNATGYYYDQMGIGVDFSGDSGDFAWEGMLLTRTGDMPSMGMPVPTGGYILEPHDSPVAPSAWYCFDDSSTLFATGDQVTISLEGLRRLGACSDGEPVEGTITACFGDASCGGQTQLDVALTDASYVIDVPGSTSSAFGDGEKLTKYSVGNGPKDAAGVLGFHATDVVEGAPGVRMAPLVEVFFISPLDQPDGGAIYCAGAGSTLTYDGASGDELSATLMNITRLGSCSDDGGNPGVGQFCANFGG